MILALFCGWGSLHSCIPSILPTNIFYFLTGFVAKAYFLFSFLYCLLLIIKCSLSFESLTL